MVTNLSSIALFTPMKRTYSDLKLTAPAGDDVTFEPDEKVLTTWEPEIEGEFWGVLALYHSEDSEMSQIMISQNLTGSACAWSISSDLMDGDSVFVDGELYWLRLDLYPGGFQAESVYLTFRAPSDDSASTPTASATQQPTSTSTSTSPEVTSIVSVTSIIYQTTPSVDRSQSTAWHYEESSYFDGQSLGPGEKAGIAIAGGVLGICVLVLLGLFIYRKRQSSTTYREPGGDHDTAVEGLAEQQAGPDPPEKGDMFPKTENGGDMGVQRHSVANGHLHEM